MLRRRGVVLQLVHELREDPLGRARARPRRELLRRLLGQIEDVLAGLVEPEGDLRAVAIEQRGLELPQLGQEWRRLRAPPVGGAREERVLLRRQLLAARAEEALRRRRAVVLEALGARPQAPQGAQEVRVLADATPVALLLEPVLDRPGGGVELRGQVALGHLEERVNRPKGVLEGGREDVFLAAALGLEQLLRRAQAGVLLAHAGGEGAAPPARLLGVAIKIERPGATAELRHGDGVHRQPPHHVLDGVVLVRRDEHLALDGFDPCRRAR